jgi:hypothetical protein
MQRNNKQLEKHLKLQLRLQDVKEKNLNSESRKDKNKKETVLFKSNKN